MCCFDLESDIRDLNDKGYNITGSYRDAQMSGNFRTNSIHCLGAKQLLGELDLAFFNDAASGPRVARECSYL